MDQRPRPRPFVTLTTRARSNRRVIVRATIPNRVPMIMRMQRIARVIPCQAPKPRSFVDQSKLGDITPCGKSVFVREEHAVISVYDNLALVSCELYNCGSSHVRRIATKSKIFRLGVNIFFDFSFH